MTITKYPSGPQARARATYLEGTDSWAVSIANETEDVLVATFPHNSFTMLLMAEMIDDLVETLFLSNIHIKEKGFVNKAFALLSAMESYEAYKTNVPDNPYYRRRT